jgi:hypothetical protein
MGFAHSTVPFYQMSQVKSGQDNETHSLFAAQPILQTA